MTTATRGLKSKERRKTVAFANAAARDKRSPKQQLRKLDREKHTAKKERKRMKSLVAKTKTKK